ncbi:MAG: PASTA domain-containing protein [Spirochaetales bacterium]|nr:PASTA domain-containing protein [Spirochaetales bacterium]
MIMIDILNKIKSIFPNKLDDPDTRYFKITIFLIIGLLGSMVLIGVIVFFTNLKGHEKIIVPNVTTTETNKMDIIDAIIKLQDKYLGVKIQEKHSSQYARGIVIEQKPRPGAVVKAGRRVTLTVSKGPVINKLGDYIGKGLGWLRLELRSKFSSDDKVLIEIREPVIYQYSDTIEKDRIIEQKPAPDTPIYENEVTYIDLVVSKGPRGQEVRAGHYVGKNYVDVMRMLESNNIPFVFELSTDTQNAKEGMVVTQTPEADEEITRLVPVQLTIAPVVTLEEDEVFDIFQYIVEKYPIPVDLKVIAQYQGESKVLVSIKHEGGKISFPYRVKSGTELIVYIMDMEQDRYLIEK